jgi:hypothetical protein
MRYCLLFILMFGSAITCFAERDTTTTIIEVRSFSSAALDVLKKDQSFQYDNAKEPTMSLWDKFWGWFWWKVRELFETKRGRTTVWAVFIVLGALVLGYAVYKIRKMNRAGVFVRGNGSGLDYKVGHEDIHQISFNEAIEEAIGNKNFRLAVRLLYLQTLKTLADRNLIDWRINKTNSDYVKEVAEKPWQALFSKLTIQFEYAWYGETNVNADRFETLRQAFKQLHNQV